ncbi:MAG: pyruvate:ferredoxin (flavodoxin) oxidoreductase [Rhodospirillaceae bacterium]|jgi:pyruvate-ferredoxin/flavodoxin oxidoreductase|nr:pyruvate:ferredoxin (flavodoxin) oxidoreductase [Rhodospirillaceae bacterium]
MANKHKITVDGNEAVSLVAHRINEVIAIYPITPSSGMGELADERSAKGHKNIWGIVPEVVEMQSEAGAAGAVHGALQSGALTTTFTSSQGLLLMIPNLYKIAGELTSFCIHVAARTVASHGLSIFGDHSDVMACRQTGVAMLAAGSVQEAHDFACIGQAASLHSRVPMLHFFDGFRTSHEIAKIEELSEDDLSAMINEDLVAAHRQRALTPDHPVLRGSAQNPDTFFQMQEARNPFYDACPVLVQSVMDRFAALTGRRYNLFDYVGHSEAEKVIVIMASGGEAVEGSAAVLNRGSDKVGVLKVRLYRPFSVDHFIAQLPLSVRAIAVMDRCKEPGAVGEPLYQDVVTALGEAKATGLRPAAREPMIIGGRYGLASKEFTPAMVKAVFDELERDTPRRHFTVGITDDVSGFSLPVDDSFKVEHSDLTSAVFFGLGSDGTVGANKNSIKIIAANTDFHTQGYFVFDSKKAGGGTISHLRFCSNPIKSPYLISQAEFVACHQFPFLEQVDIIKYATPGGTFLLHAPYGKDEVWDKLPRTVQQQIIDKKLKFYVIDAQKVADKTGMGKRINTIMQTCFFAITDVLECGQAIAAIKDAINRTYSHKSEKVLQSNFAAVDQALAHLEEVTVPDQATAGHDRPPTVPEQAPDFVKRVTAMMLSGQGDLLPVSAFPVDGTWPLGTAKWEKCNLATEIPTWIPELCIQCNKCTLVCPHAAIRVKVSTPADLEGAPAAFQSMDYKGKEFGEAKYIIQVAPEDCTGCTLCVRVCPGKDKNDLERLSLEMQAQPPLRDREREKWDFFLELPEVDRTKLRPTLKMTQFVDPLIEFSGACVGCGETPYIKLVTQLFGDRTMIANATGCSSIYGGNLPTTPYTTNREGRGPAWSNSLFEDNAEFGLGFRLAVDRHFEHAKELLNRLGPSLDATLVDEILTAEQPDQAAVIAQRQRIETLRGKLAGIDSADALRLDQIADYLVRKNVWIIGGDGWAYDIGYGGLDHVLASGRDVNILVLDTEVYSNTGGQQSKATAIGAVAKFANAGKVSPKKDLGLMAMAYGEVYVASIAFGASDGQTVKALQEAESYDGPSLIIAYSPCIEHGYDLANELDQMKLAVETGYWMLYRYDPRRLAAGGNPLQLDCKAPSRPLGEYLSFENRFSVVKRRDPKLYQKLLEAAESNLRHRRAVYEKLAEVAMPSEEVESGAMEAVE